SHSILWPIMHWSLCIMAVQLICPNLKCRKLLVVPEEVRGKMVKCQHCQTQFRVPESKTPSPAK
ncbi:MAG TPA: MJ0042-type zinc finger domain-containing protein, partial [Tepidisphaeraceae bacterium]|nr:MJ0042-type zinc finger domain-containing protein [Tepidisphaeraceae bacterium]